jgi:hypothetical protein
LEGLSNLVFLFAKNEKEKEKEKKRSISNKGFRAPVG